MARVTVHGVEPLSLPGYVARLNDVFRSALGSDLDLAPETPQGQLIGVLALVLAEQDEALAAVANGLSITHALGMQLDDLGSLLGIERRHQAQSTVAVTLTGTPDTLIPADSRARTTGGDVFALTAAYAIEAGGSVVATMRAIASGPVAAPAGTLTEIVDLIPGWTGVTNPSAAMVGHDTETDVMYRARFARETARNARSTVDAVIAAVLGVEGVTDVLARENATSAAVTVQGKSIEAHSIYLVVKGGADADVAAAIARSKTGGTATSGEVSVDVPHASGDFNVSIRFDRVVNIPVTLTIDTTIGDGFPGNGADELITRVIDWAAGRWRSGPGDFDTSGLGIGEPLDTNRLLSPIQSVPGHSVNSLTVQRKIALIGSTLTGGSPSALTTLQAITAGALTFEGASLTGLNFAAENTYADIASELEIELQGAGVDKLDEATVSYDDDLGVFVVTLQFDSAGAPYQIDGFATGSSAAALGFTEAAGASVVQQPRSTDITTASGVLLNGQLTIAAEDVTIA